MRTQKINWNEVYQQQSGLLIGVAYRYVGEREIAEDVVQEAFVKAIEKAGQFSGRGAFEAWLRRIVVNEALMALRKPTLKTENLKEDMQAFSTDEVETVELEDGDWDYTEDPNKRKVIERCDFSREELLEFTTQLPEYHRLVFNMYVIDGFSHKEIAEQLNIKRGTSLQHLSRAKKKMQEILYKKARDVQEKERSRKRLSVAVWIGALFGKTSIVETTYANAFSDFRMLAPPPSLGIEQAILSTPATATIGLSTTAVAIIAGCVSVAVGVGGTIAILDRQNQPAEQLYTLVEYQADDTEELEALENLQSFIVIDYVEEATQAEPPIYTATYTRTAPIEVEAIEEYDPTTIITRRVTINRVIIYE